MIKKVFILSFFIAIAGFSISFNPSHLESLSQNFFLEGQEVKGYWVYAEKRGDKYQVLGAKGEGDFCVDDVARVVLLYSEAYEKTGKKEYLDLAKEAARFVLRMQASDGLLYNFAYLDGTINKHGPTSAKIPSSWWTLRAFWGLSKLAQFTKDEEVLRSIQAIYHAVKKSPPETSSRLALFILGLCEYNKVFDVKEDIKEFADKLLDFIREDFVGTFFSVYKERFSWNGWGNHYAEALVEAYIATGEENYLKVAEKMLESQVPLFLATGLIYSIDRYVHLFPELSYSLDCIVTPLVKIWEITGEEKYAYLTSLAASWLFGGNRLGVPMLGPNGEGYDGLEYLHVNRNAGAESTICALRVVLHAMSLPYRYQNLIENPHIVSRKGLIVLEAESGNPGISDVKIVTGDFGGGAAVTFKGNARLKWESQRVSGKYRVFASGNFSDVSLAVYSNMGEKIEKNLSGDGIFYVGEIMLDNSLRISLSGSGFLDQLILVPERYGISFREGEKVKSVFFDLRENRLYLVEGQVFQEEESKKQKLTYRVSLEVISNYAILNLEEIFNNDGFGTPVSPGNFDNPAGIVGAYFPANEIEEGLIFVESTPFLLKVSGLDNVRCFGQRISLEEAIHVKNLHLLMAANHGDYEIEIFVDDKMFKVTATDWCILPKELMFDYRYIASGEKQNIKCGLDLISIPVDTPIKEITLPNAPNVHVFAITLEFGTEGER
ncbi:MAG: hypothetical protein XD64_0536 [Thermotoga sp. 47_83]|jgi:hypothetical protein|uniref:Uncharacterized protein n=2 Tax=Thermotoga petrophila TaxID=93929 RepID=D2C6X0_THEP2|nr:MULTISPECIES: hypothetical protein [Thermotoga]KUK23397.1 MAG: hypothetical protein XD57_0507 [Thermotoga petrophila]KUK33638.1 MAG: hypothetical protein XD64_0536 [Thermotoga sp. 47_83]MDK2898231.1 hypothetical protein [Thermotoga sp.]ADA66706.1 conserved hypothetical protein [Thermotoga petrophila RKU-10]KAF2960772.1 hypothetical protein AS158_03740 [Thermotoga sp. 38H-to]